MAKRGDVTRDLLGGAIRQRGRPATGVALTPAERQSLRREKLKDGGKGVLTVDVSLDVLKALDAFVQFKDETKGQVVDRILRGTLLRKR